MYQRPVDKQVGRRMFFNVSQRSPAIPLSAPSEDARTRTSAIQSRIASSPSSSFVLRSKCHAALTSNPFRSSNSRVFADAWEIPRIRVAVAAAFEDGFSGCDATANVSLPAELGHKATAGPKTMRQCSG